MEIIVASKNPVKVQAVRDVLRNYSEFINYDIVGVEANSNVSEQPKSLEETIQGAINRSVGVFSGCVYSFGIESGLMEVPMTKTGYMDLCVCAIYDGKDYSLGLSCAFEHPIKVIQMINEESLDVNDAFYKCGLVMIKLLVLQRGQSVN